MTRPNTNDAQASERIFSARKIMFVGAHPDDIEFYCGALVYMLRKAGVAVTFAIGTRGGKGKQGRAKDRLERARSQDQLEAAEILGGAAVVLFDYPDKGLSSHIPEYATDIKNLIESEKPDLIFSWDPEHIYNPHPDHQAAAKAGKIAAEGWPVVYYGTREPNLWIGFDDGELRMKVRSLRAHRTETPWYYWMLVSRRLFRKLTKDGEFVESKYAEVYRVSLYDSE